ncbi:hypothetical protein AB0L40_03565 [Patulibacter sp. NPDC049589]|uniref:hypothetical protein n=1 Tax=Patulibacter sp. NPDC049589 TaxID=3154731 RepID=UPI0034347D4A
MTVTPHDPTDPWAQAVRNAMSPARALEPTEDEIQRALTAARAQAAPRRRVASRFVTSTTILATLFGTIAVVPATRAAVSDAYGTLSEWVSGDGSEQPGRAVTADDETPEWITAKTEGTKRFIAGRNGANIYVVRDGDQLSIAFGSGSGIGSTIDEWRERFHADKIVPLGLGTFARGRDVDGVSLDSKNRRAFMGLTAKIVTRVELSYTTGAPTTVDNVHDGFVLLADATRRPDKLTAYDSHGATVETRDASNLDLRVCSDARGCPPGTPKPNVEYRPEIEPGAAFLPQTH